MFVQFSEVFLSFLRGEVHLILPADSQRCVGTAVVLLLLIRQALALILDPEVGCHKLPYPSSLEANDEIDNRR